MRKVDLCVLVSAAVTALSGLAGDRLPPLQVAEIRGLGSTGVPKVGPAVPAELQWTAEELKARAAERLAEAKEIGSVPRVTPFKAGHSFGTFVKRSWKTDRWCLGLMPNGKRGVDLENVPGYFPNLSKMCVSNDRLVDEKVAEWVKQGKPRCLRCGENDGLLGYCRCEKCRALDADLPGDRFLRNKSDRYVDFWNRVCEKARAIRPDVMVTVHLYSVLRHPPRKAKITYPDNLMCSYVPSLQDADPCEEIRRWKAAGLRHFYTRPNWLCAYSAFPLGLARKVYDLHRGLFALGSLGMDEDAAVGNPVIGLEVCTLEHLCADPNVPFAKIEDWWYGRFGAARATVEVYNRQVVARCDREWPKLLKRLEQMDIAFLDDGGFARYVHQLHTVEELEADCAILDRFDASALTGEAARRFAVLKDNARHAALTKRAYVSRSAADKAALAAFRKAHKLSLGSGWKRVYAGIESDLWTLRTDPNRVPPEWSQEVGAERLEERLRIDTLKFPVPEMTKAPHVGCSAQQSPTIPEGLRYTEEEAKAIAARQKADSEAAGYVERRPYHSGHYTSRLLKRFWGTHREYFGLMPNGVRGVDLPDWPPFFRGLSKACVSNEAVVDQKIADWVKAGKPQLFIAGEDDGLLGYCRCEKCCALDADLPGERFVHHKTDRYINFWNRLCAKAVKLRPDVMVTVFAYSVLRHPPRREKIAYPDNMRFSFIPTFHDTDKMGMVAAWKKAGMKHFYLRPNYLCPRNHMPYGIEKTIYDEIRAFLAAGASGFQFDGSRGFPTIAFETYVVERLSADPNVPFATIERDFCARYGAAAKTVRDYYVRVRARCDREWPKLVQWLKENDLEFLDDGHICLYLDRLHTVAEFEDDLKLLETFDAATLTGDAARRFADLKANVEHQILLKKALLTKSEADKAALTAFRLAHRDALGWGFKNAYNKGEVKLWHAGTKKEAYMRFGEEAFVETYENTISLPGEYPGHLQDVWTDGDAIWWAHTQYLVKTDRRGVIARKAEVGGHHAGLEVRDGRLYSAVCAYNGEPRGATTPECHVMVGEYDATTLERIEMHVLDINDRAGSFCFLADGTMLVGCLRHPALKPNEVKFHHLDRNFKLIKTHVVDVGMPVKLGIEVIRRYGDDLYLFIYGGPVMNLDAKDFSVKNRFRSFGGQMGFARDGKFAWCGQSRRQPDGKQWKSSLVRRPLVWEPFDFSLNAQNENTMKHKETSK